MWCWCRREKFSCTGTVINEELLHRTQEGRSIVRAINGGKGKRIGNTLHRSCLLKYVTEEKVGGTRRKGRRRKLLNDLQEYDKY
jgi:hypothetical protein